MNQDVIYLCMPASSRQVDIGAARSLFGTSCKGPGLGGTLKCFPDFFVSSMLTQNFNRLWQKALALRVKGVTHFAMIHSDIDAEYWFLDILHEELTTFGADVVSTVVPIKGEEGITSTGVVRTDDHEHLVRRLTLKECHFLPETFCADDVGPGLYLAINTGLWIADLRKPWVEDVVFDVENWIGPHRTGDDKDLPREADANTEDWLFAKDLHRWGAKVYATRKVKVEHWGAVGFPNSVWGSWATDHVYRMMQEDGKVDQRELCSIDERSDAERAKGGEYVTVAN